MEESASTTGPANERSIHHRKIAPILGLAAAVALAFAPTLLNDFFLDDFFNLENAFKAGWSPSKLTRGFSIDAEVMHDGVELPTFRGHVISYFRPVFLASIVFDHTLWGTRPFGYHLTNVLLHVAVAVVFFGVLRELLPGRPRMAWFGAFFWSISHFHSFTVGWLSGRTELWPALSMLVALWGLLRFARTRAPAPYVLSLAALAFALISKENAVVFPLLALVAWLWAAPRPRPAFALLIPHVLLVAVYFIARRHFLGGFPLPPECFYYHSPTEPAFALWFVAKSACVFFDLLFGLSLVYPIEMVLYHNPPAAIVLFVAASAIALGVFRLVHTTRDEGMRRLGYFAIAWIFIGMAPTAPLMVTGLYFYFPLCGVVLLYLVLWHRLTEAGRPRWLWKGRRRRVVVGTVVVLMLAALLINDSVFYRMSRSTRRVTEKVAAVLGEPARGTRLFLIDLPWFGSYLGGGLRMVWPGTDVEIHLLSGDPRLFPKPQTISEVTRIDERTLEIRSLVNPFWSGVFGIIGTGDRGPEQAQKGDVYRGPDYRVELAEVEKGGLFNRNCVRSFVYRFDKPFAAANHIFLRFGENGPERLELE